MQRSYGSGYGGYGKGYGKGYKGFGQGQRSYGAPPQPQQAQYNSTPEQKAEYGSIVRDLQNKYFMRALRLAVLPGGFPMCFAVGRGLVTDYEVWAAFKEACKKKAETEAKAEVYKAEGAPFTWGVRPISPKDIHPLSEAETCWWIWDFVLLNIAPYGACRREFFRSIHGFTTFGELRQACLEGSWPSDEALMELAAAIDTSVAITPGQLAMTFKENPAGTADIKNMGFLQMSPERAQDRASRAEAQVQRAAAAAAAMTQVATDADEDEDGFPAPPAVPRQPRQNFLSDSEDDGM